MGSQAKQAVQAGCEEKPLSPRDSQAVKWTGCRVSVLEQPGLTSELTTCWAGGWTGPIPRFLPSILQLFYDPWLPKLLISASVAGDWCTANDQFVMLGNWTEKTMIVSATTQQEIHRRFWISVKWDCQKVRNKVTYMPLYINSDIFGACHFLNHGLKHQGVLYQERWYQTHYSKDR